ncbi:MAG TPA: DNA polymerase III subunit delta [Candidatus Avibacteroides faecavium]|nr:DNA polymerase III subunit delta [Candidatus Avibacteroides faecavium]
MFFRDVIGQAGVKRSLIGQFAEGRVPHALMFSGPPGCGKLPMALAFAQYLLCEHPGADDACGHCRSCMMMANRMEHPDLHFAFPVVKRGGATVRCDDYLRQWNDFVTRQPYFSYQSWLDEIKAGNSQAMIYANESDEIIRKLSFKSAMGGCKVLVIWLPEKMHEACANKLLKLIEEPQGKTCIIMVTEDKPSVLGTVRSRAQDIVFKGIASDDLAAVLERNCGLQPDQAAKVAASSEGSFVKCLKTIEVDSDTGFCFDMFVRLMRLAYARDVREMKAWSEAMADIGREKQKMFFDYAQHMVRENFVYNFHIDSILGMDDRERKFATRFAPFINERNAVSIVEKMSEAASNIEGNVNAKMVFFDFALKMIVEIAVKGARRG